jgi:GcrA cell cycle regulator
MASPHLEWPIEHDNILRDMVAKGCTSTEIAAKLHRTRNAIIGRATRMKLIWKRGPGYPKRKSAKPKPKSKIRNKILSMQGGAKKELFIQDRSPLVIKLKAEGMSLLLATYGHCRWPVESRGVDRMPRCCGAKCHGSYCPDHHRISVMTKKSI